MQTASPTPPLKEKKQNKTLFPISSAASAPSWEIEAAE